MELTKAARKQGSIGLVIQNVGFFITEECAVLTSTANQSGAFTVSERTKILELTEMQQRLKG